MGLLLLGAALSAFTIASYLAADAHGHGLEATTWVMTASNAGISAGAALGGILIDRAGPTTTLLLAATPAAAVSAVTALSNHLQR